MINDAVAHEQHAEVVPKLASNPEQSLQPDRVDRALAVAVGALGGALIGAVGGGVAAGPEAGLKAAVALCGAAILVALGFQKWRRIARWRQRVNFLAETQDIPAEASLADQRGWRDGVKRFEDIILASASLVALAPAMAAIALIIRLDSPGPIVFKQVRIGLGGRPFHLLKFRTMHSNLLIKHEDGRRTSYSDPRVTRIGRFLRRTSLDELPQLINVLVGDVLISRAASG